MQIPVSRIRPLAPPQQYVEAVCSHLERLLLQLSLGQIDCLPEYVAGDGQPPMSSTFGRNLAMCMSYLRGEATVPAVELPDLLQAIYEVVHGVSGCEDLEAAVLAEHERIAEIPLTDATVLRAVPIAHG